MNTALRDILLKKCRKYTSDQSYDEEEEWEGGEEAINDFDEAESREELPLEDILAEKRRKYTVREEFIFLLYNDLLQFFVKEWDGKVLRKKPKKRVDDQYENISSEDEDSEEYLPEVNNDEGMSESKSNMFWKVSVPDEFANITFISNNTYSGRISRKMMEGKGVYKWSNGAQYKGDFEQNRMHGKGLLEWNSDCWYEGEFANGYRHGRGIMVDGENRYMYTGKWYKGMKHGKGYCRYGDNGSYDGDWVMNKMDGVGIRTYAKGSCYYGQWKNGLRHGRGTMVWPNGDVYRGEWKCGSMHGYGEYVWNGFFNKTFTWPREALYVGHWRNGMRHGEGDLTLNAIGGARYSGFWMDNKKHGYGVIIGNNGEKFESDTLFLNDVLCSTNIENIDLNNEPEAKNEVKCIRMIKEVQPKFVEKPNELGEAPVLPVLKPEQFPSLSYYIIRLLSPESLEERPLPSSSPAKCYSCANESCTCLSVNSADTKKQDKNEKEATDSSKTETDTTDPIINNEIKSNYRYEERWTYNCITFHMARLREIYDHYARLFTKSAPKCNLAMSRICLWQLWRDCGIHRKGLSLIDIDNYMVSAKNKSTLVKDPHHPFEKIEIWQFIYALLEVSWQLYTKFDDIETEEINGKLAGGLLKFLKNDVYPHVGNHVGNVHQKYQDLLPMDAVFQLYKQIGYPFSAKDLLRTMCAVNDSTDLQPVAATETIKSLPNGINCVNLGEKLNYLLKFDDILMHPRSTIEISENNENDSAYGLLAFKELGILKLLEIMTLISPAIKDDETDTIVNMDYEFTFLEFYEIIMEATKQLLFTRKNLSKTAIEGEDASPQNNDSQKKESVAKIGRSLTRKSFKIKNKT